MKDNEGSKALIFEMSRLFWDTFVLIKGINKLNDYFNRNGWKRYFLYLSYKAQGQKIVNCIAYVLKKLQERDNIYLSYFQRI